MMDGWRMTYHPISSPGAFGLGELNIGQYRKKLGRKVRIGRSFFFFFFFFFFFLYWLSFLLLWSWPVLAHLGRRLLRSLSDGRPSVVRRPSTPLIIHISTVCRLIRRYRYYIKMLIKVYNIMLLNVCYHFCPVTCKGARSVVLAFGWLWAVTAFPRPVRLTSTSNRANMKTSIHFMTFLLIHYENTQVWHSEYFHDSKTDIFLIKSFDICLIFASNNADLTGTHAQSLFSGDNKKHNVYPCKPHFFYIKWGLHGIHFTNLLT